MPSMCAIPTSSQGERKHPSSGHGEAQGSGKQLAIAQPRIGYSQRWREHTLRTAWRCLSQSQSLDVWNKRGPPLLEVPCSKEQGDAMLLSDCRA